MAGDSMLVNFDIAPDTYGPGGAVPKFKGGRWKDRLKAKRAVEHKLQKQATGTIHTANSDPKPTKPQALKRKRDEEKPKHQPHPQTNKSGDFVSSLWTANPEATTPLEAAVPEGVQEPSNAPLPDGSATFTALGLSPILANHLTTKLSLKYPTAIQRSAIPELVSTDSDAFIQAETGSGKTLTYLLPIVNRIMSLPALSSGEIKQSRHSGLYAIVLAPTRELCRQISTVLSTLIHCKNGPHWIVPSSVSGGEKKKSEKARLRKGVNILVATPGRLLDHLENTASLDVSRVRWIVLDEGDRLMELGFEETIGSILGILEKKSKLPTNGGDPLWSTEGGLPKRRVSMLCSATMKANVQRLGDISLKEALYIKAENNNLEGSEENKNNEEEFQAPAQLRQSYVVVPAKLRLVGLNAILARALIRQTANPKIIVFFSCSDSVDFHFGVFSRSQEDKDEKKTLKSNNPAVSKSPLLHPSLLLHKLHGSLPQPTRTSVLSSFTATKLPSILFCTDVAARGLDLPNIDLIIQFDPPFSPSDHLHRVGRTARAGRPGRAVMFLLPGPEESYVDAVLKKGGQPIRADLDDVLKKGFGEGKKREWEDKATEWQLEVERWVVGNNAVKDLAARAWGSHIRAYTTHIAAEKSIFNHKVLHYGHLAKSFGLRDTPGNMRTPAAGTGVGKGGKDGGVKRGMDPDTDTEDTVEVASNQAVRKMRKVAFSMQMKKGMSSEFNLG